MLATVSLLAGCSPVYVLQSAAGHADLLMRRKSIARAIEDPRTPPELRAKLVTADSSRQFAFERMGLKKSADFSTYVQIGRPAVTYLVSASRRTKLEAYEWWFPVAGRFPYKGYFKLGRAVKERDRLEAQGWDAAISGAAAYKTPLPFADPLPSSALSFSTGALAALLIHEFTHGTVYFKDRMDFNEALAEWVGHEGAQAYLSQRFGPSSRELADYRAELDAEKRADDVFSALYGKLDALYGGPGSDEEKLARRAPLLDQARGDLQRLGYKYDRLNNAVVTAHRVYHADLPFEAVLRANGGDWPKTLAALKTLDRKDPAGDLRRRYRAGAGTAASPASAGSATP